MTTGRSKGSGLEWFVRRGNTVRGPFSSARVRHFVLEDKLELNDEVSADRKAWQRLGSVPEVVPLQLRAHDAALDTNDKEQSGGGRASRTILIASLVIGLLTLAVYLAGDRTDTGEIDCAASPAPGVSYEGCRLTAIDLRSARLSGSNFANAVLADALLNEADLSQADLRYADLSSADLSYANLQGAVLKGANLRLADLTNADLRGADLSFADLSRASIGGARVEDAFLEGAIWIDGRRCETAACPR